MSDNEKTKCCPFCGEEVLEVAIKCKHCGSDLSEQVAQDKEAKEAAKQRVIELGDELKTQIRSFIENNPTDSTKNLFSGIIPQDKIKKAKAKYADQLKSDSSILLLGEGKSMGFFLCGFILTEEWFYYWGVNNYNNGLAGSRKGAVRITQVKTLKFVSEFASEDHFVLNGLGPDQSDLIPKYFNIGSDEQEYMNRLFSSLKPTLEELQQEKEKTQDSPSPHKPNTQKTSGKKIITNPVDLGPKQQKKEGCFVVGLRILALLVVIPLALLFLYWTLF